MEAFVKFEEALKEVELLLEETENAFYLAENSQTPNKKEGKRCVNLSATR